MKKWTEVAEGCKARQGHRCSMHGELCCRKVCPIWYWIEEVVAPTNALFLTDQFEELGKES